MTGPDGELEEESKEKPAPEGDAGRASESSTPKGGETAEDGKNLSDSQESTKDSAESESKSESDKKEAEKSEAEVAGTKSESLEEKSDSKSDEAKEEKPESKSEADSESKADEKNEEKPEAKSEPKSDDEADKKSESKSDESKSDESKPESKSDEKSSEAKSDESKSGDAEPESDIPVNNVNATNLTLTQHHVSHLLNDVLQETPEDTPVIKNLRFPMIFDVLLGLGLLVAVGGFTIGLFHMYLVHSASQSISEQHYKAAISILKGAPMPQVFARPGSDTEELLSKARYLDAMDKLENGTELEDAIKELGEIRAGSKYFTLAQEAINENTEPAPMMLQGGTEHVETNPSNAEESQSLLEKTLKEEEHKE